MKTTLTPYNGVSLLFILLYASLFGCTEAENRQTTQPDSDKPKIVSLAPSITEMIYAIGAEKQLIGRTSACDWPKGVEKIQVVGAFGKPSLEVLASLSPDLVLDTDLADENVGSKITELGFQRERLAISVPGDIPPALRRLGRLTGNPEKADSLALVIEDDLKQFLERAKRLKYSPNVYLEIWDDPLWTGGKNSYVSALIAYAGGKNIGNSVQKEYFEVSPEWVIQQNPDIILCMYMSREEDVIEKVRSRPGWELINAIKRGNIHDNFDNSIFLRPGPRVLEGIEQLTQILDAASDEQRK
ncbi:MAG: cobalamin-binding protein [Chlorobium phaeobacteroides]|uniref:Periplasmic binding protein n=1 Tax=Chlorobium phaeobacteroides (strain BS1) TaxID=331678 RepID=B3EJT0_CHLPB|nr:cobalamin-binding protein [Chlorobium phaeobacteroides]